MFTPRTSPVQWTQRFWVLATAPYSVLQSTWLERFKQVLSQNLSSRVSRKDSQDHMRKQERPLLPLGNQPLCLLKSVWSMCIIKREWEDSEGQFCESYETPLGWGEELGNMSKKNDYSLDHHLHTSIETWPGRIFHLSAENIYYLPRQEPGSCSTV